MTAGLRERCSQCGRAVGVRINRNGDRVAVRHIDRVGVSQIPASLLGKFCVGTSERTVEQIDESRRAAR